MEQFSSYEKSPDRMLAANNQHAGILQKNICQSCV
jgi:hypothetical protein